MIELDPDFVCLFPPKPTDTPADIRTAIDALESTIETDLRCRVCPNNHCLTCPLKAVHELAFHRARLLTEVCEDEGNIEVREDDPTTPLVLTTD